jgi:hypothetical protein
MTRRCFICRWRITPRFQPSASRLSAGNPTPAALLRSRIRFRCARPLARNIPRPGNRLPMTHAFPLPSPLPKHSASARPSAPSCPRHCCPAPVQPCPPSPRRVRNIALAIFLSMAEPGEKVPSCSCSVPTTAHSGRALRRGVTCSPHFAPFALRPHSAIHVQSIAPDPLPVLLTPADALGRSKTIHPSLPSPSTSWTTPHILGCADPDRQPLPQCLAPPLPPLAHSPFCLSVPLQPLPHSSAALALSIACALCTLDGVQRPAALAHK